MEKGDRFSDKLCLWAFWDYVYMANDGIQWAPEAEAKLKEIPFFVRPAARKKLEKFAQEAGHNLITAEVYDQAKRKFGQK